MHLLVLKPPDPIKKRKGEGSKGKVKEEKRRWRDAKLEVKEWKGAGRGVGDWGEQGGERRKE